MLQLCLILVSTKKIVLDGSSKKVAVDAVGCKPDDWVICVGSSAAREAAGSAERRDELALRRVVKK